MYYNIKNYLKSNHNHTVKQEAKLQRKLLWHWISSLACNK
jgi:hypothetical protein